MRIGKQHLVVIRGLAISVAVLAAASFALSTLIRDAASTTPAPARPDDRAAAPAERSANRPGAPANEETSDPLVIREAHSDGGYTYSLERQPVERARP
jgi:hypothetical protein